MMAKVKIQMYLDVSRCILMDMNGKHQDTCEIHARYMRDTWDTYPDNKPPPNSITNPTSPVTAHRSPAPPPPGPGRPAPGAAPVAKKWVVCPDSHAIEKWTSSR